MNVIRKNRNWGFISIRTKLACVIALLIALAVAAVEIYDYQVRNRKNSNRTTIKYRGIDSIQTGNGNNQNRFHPGDISQ